MAIDDLAHGALLEPEQRGEQANGVVEVLRVLADNRNAVGVAVLDQHLAVAVEDHPARSAQRERALIVVLGQLRVLLVLGHLQAPRSSRPAPENSSG